jgi:hypothetical protein
MRSEYILRRERCSPLKLRGKMERRLRAPRASSWLEMQILPTWWFFVSGENIALSALDCCLSCLSAPLFQFLPSVYCRIGSAVTSQCATILSPWRAVRCFTFVLRSLKEREVFLPYRGKVMCMSKCTNLYTNLPAKCSTLHTIDPPRMTV